MCDPNFDSCQTSHVSYYSYHSGKTPVLGREQPLHPPNPNSDYQQSPHLAPGAEPSIVEQPQNPHHHYERSHSLSQHPSQQQMVHRVEQPIGSNMNFEPRIAQQQFEQRQQPRLPPPHNQHAPPPNHHLVHGGEPSVRNLQYEQQTQQQQRFISQQQQHRTYISPQNQQQGPQQQIHQHIEHHQSHEYILPQNHQMAFAGGGGCSTTTMMSNMAAQNDPQLCSPAIMTSTFQHHPQQNRLPSAAALIHHRQTQPVVGHPNAVSMAPPPTHLARPLLQSPQQPNLYCGSQRFTEKLLAQHNCDLQHGQQPQKSPKERYRELKRNFKFLVYENECYQEELRTLQRKLLKLSRDKNFLLDKMVQFEPPSSDSSDDDSDASRKTIVDAPKPKRARCQQPKRPAAERRKKVLESSEGPSSLQLSEKRPSNDEALKKCLEAESVIEKVET